MVKAIITISDEANRIFNIVKAKHGLRDKSEAINLIAEQYGEELLEPELRPEFIAKIQKIEKRKLIHVGNVDNLRKIMGIK